MTNRCNLKCLYCRCPEIRSSELTTTQWLRVVQGLGRLGTLRIKFQGGEPTLRTDFAELCGEVRRTGMIAAVVTNGLRIAAEPSLLDHLDEVVISLDSVTPEIHDRLRGSGTHARVVQAIDAAVSRGVPTYLVMVVSQVNQHELDAMVRFCEDRGLRMNAQPAVFGRSYFDDSARHIGLNPLQIRDMHRQLGAWKRAGRPLMFSAPTYDKAASWPDYDALSVLSMGRSRCMAGRYYVHIDPSGDLRPCQQHDSDLTPKNVVRDGLEEALRHVRHHRCGDCFATYLNERKALFGLRPSAVVEVFRRG